MSVEQFNNVRIEGAKLMVIERKYRIEINRNIELFMADFKVKGEIRDVVEHYSVDGLFFFEFGREYVEVFNFPGLYSEGARKVDSIPVSYPPKTLVLLRTYESGKDVKLWCRFESEKLESVLDDYSSFVLGSLRV